MEHFSLRRCQISGDARSEPIWPLTTRKACLGHEPQSSWPMGLLYRTLSWRDLHSHAVLESPVQAGGDSSRCIWKVSFLRAGALSVLLRLEP